MRGHLRKRGACSWELKYDIPRDGGGRRIQYRSFKGTKREAQAELARILSRVADGAHTNPNKITVAELVGSRLTQWRASGTISVKVAERYAGLLKYQIAPFLGNVPVQRLHARDIEAWHTALKTKGRQNGSGGVSPRTVTHAHKLLVKSLREAVRHGFVLKNVAAEERPPKVITKTMRILTPEQLGNLPVQLAGQPMHALVVMALFTGLRRGELLALRWSCIDLSKKIVRVRESLDETKEHGLRFKSAKTESGQREVSLPEIVIGALREHRRQQLEQRLSLGLGKASEDAMVFATPEGRPLRPNGVSAEWARLRCALGLEKVSFHALRHTHASQLIDAGVDVVTIARRLGHASPAITLNTYAHLFRKDDSKAAAAINAALKG
jgi:integrase